MPRNLILKNKQIRLKRRRMIIKVYIVIIIIVLLFAGFVFGMNSYKVLISNIRVSGNAVVSSKDLKREITNILDGNFFWILPKSNIFIYPKQKIEQKILNTYRRIYDVEISTAYMNSIEVSVKERYPFALWCGDSIYKNGRNISNRCYFLDKSGFIFDEAPNFSDNVYFEFYSSIKGNVIGHQLLPVESFVRLIKFRNFLNANGVSVNKFLINKKGDYVFYVNDKKNTAIFFDKLQNFDELSYNLKSAIDVKTTNNREKDIFKNLKYIDLRFDNKVLFKY